MRVLIINGPNLNLTGIREPEVYGNVNFEEYLSYLRDKYKDVLIDYFQTNIEGEIIDKLHAASGNYDGVIMNCGGYSHTSVAISDAVAAISTPVVEVHISNVFAREQYRQIMLTAQHSSGIISGFDLKSYELALMSFIC